MVFCGRFQGHHMHTLEYGFEELLISDFTCMTYDTANSLKSYFISCMEKKENCHNVINQSFSPIYHIISLKRVLLYWFDDIIEFTSIRRVSC